MMFVVQISKLKRKLRDIFHAAPANGNFPSMLCGKIHDLLQTGNI